MSRKSTCPFCHMSVAPYDRERLERNGQAAHEGCVKRKSQPGVYDACVKFFTGRGSAHEASVFMIRAKSATTPRVLAKTIGTVLRSLVAKLDDEKAIADVTRFASQMADRLYVDIGIGTVAPKSPKNGVPSSQHA